MENIQAPPPGHGKHPTPLAVTGSDAACLADVGFIRSVTVNDRFLFFRRAGRGTVRSAAQQQAIPKIMKTTLALLSLLCAGAASATAAVVFQDNFANNDRTGWYTFTTSTTATDAFNPTVGWRLTPQTGTTLSAITYFTPASLAVGQSIELSFEFRQSLTTTSGTGFRFGLFDSQGTRISANQTGTGGTANAAFNDDRGYATFASLSSNTSHFTDIRERVTANDTFWTNGAFATLGALAPRVTTAANTTYLASLLITYVDASTVSITSTINGVSMTRTDSSSLLTTFDALSIFTDGNSGTMSYKNVVVTTSGIPEPSASAALLGVAGLGLAICRRRPSRPASQES